MIQKFSQHGQVITEAKKETAVFGFGRMNPPTVGHQAVVEKIKEVAQQKGGDPFLFVSKSQDPEKNPLTHTQKVSYLKKLFPGIEVPLNKAINPFDTVLYLCSQGYKNIVVVTGSDHAKEYEKIATYKGKKDSSGRVYSFDTLEIVTAGAERNASADGVAGMSASKMRAAVREGDFATFAKGVPGTDKALKKKLYNDVRKGMTLKEQFLEEKVEPEGVTILALTSSEKDLSDTVEKMEKICKRKGIRFYGVKTRKAQIEISSVASKKITIKNYDGEEHDAVIDPGNTVCVVRGGVMNSQIGVAILTILQNNGVFMVNERGGMELCANKLETAIALKKHGLPHPRTAYVANEENIEQAVKEIGGKFPVIVKTLTGAEGIGVSKIESLESLKSVLQTLWKYGAEIIIQEFLPDFKNDVRSIILNGKIFACAEREKAPKDFRTNIARGSKGGSHQLSKEEIELVEKAARVSKCFYVGIDHVISGGKPYIIEMNASPGSGNIYYRYYEDGKGKDNVKGPELVEDFVEYLSSRANWKLFSNLAVKEKVKIDGVEYEAKIDTGNSGYNMIHGEDIKDNGNHTCTFTLPSGKKVTKQIVSRITVKSGIGVKKRMVVLMDIEFHGKRYNNIKFSVGDRSHMSSNVLIGLQFLSKTGLNVDPSTATFPHPGGTKAADGGKDMEESVDPEIRNARFTTEQFSRIPRAESIERALDMERISKIKGHHKAAGVYRAFVEEQKSVGYSGVSEETTPEQDVEHLLFEASPPSGPARRFSKKEKIKKEFQQRYGTRWKEVFYATAWKLHNESASDGDPVETATNEIYRRIVEGSWDWTPKGKRGPLPIGTNKIVNTYKKDTPGQQIHTEEASETDENDKVYKEWSKLVNMSAKELSSFIDSSDGKEAGLSRKEAGSAGSDGGKIKSGRDSARAIVRMLERKRDNWTGNDWAWAKRQINFINRMKGASGKLRESDGTPTRKLLALKIWGHNPEK